MTSLILSKCSYITFSQSYTGAQHQIAAFERKRTFGVIVQFARSLAKLS